MNYRNDYANVSRGLLSPAQGGCMYDAACLSASRAPIHPFFTLSNCPSHDRNDASTPRSRRFASNRKSPRVEINVTRTKQTPAHISNRNKRHHSRAAFSAISIPRFGGLSFLIGTARRLESALTPSVLTPEAILIGTICPTFLRTSTHPPAARIQRRGSPIATPSIRSPHPCFRTSRPRAALLASVGTAVLLSNSEVDHERQ